MDDNQKNETPQKESVTKMIVTIAVGVVFIYFVLDARAFPSWAWAGLTVFTALVVLLVERRSSGEISEETYERWKLLFFFIGVISLLLSSLWHGTLSVLVLGIILGFFWFRALYAHKERFRKRRQKGIEK